MEITSNFEMLRSDPAHLGSGPMISSTQNPAKPQSQVKSEKSFNSYLMDAMESVNQKQNASTSMAQRIVTDPDSVNVEDVTTAMAEAKLSLSMAQSVIDSMIKGWNEITTTR